jgi:hypothetical protein
MILLWLTIRRKIILKYVLAYIIIFIIPAYIALVGGGDK